MEKWERNIDAAMELCELVSLIIGVFRLFYKSSVKWGLGFVSLSYLISTLRDNSIGYYYDRVCDVIELIKGSIE